MRIFPSSVAPVVTVNLAARRVARSRNAEDEGSLVNNGEFIFPVIPSYIFDRLSEGAGDAAGIMQKYSR